MLGENSVGQSRQCCGADTSLFRWSINKSQTFVEDCSFGNHVVHLVKRNRRVFNDSSETLDEIWDRINDTVTLWSLSHNSCFHFSADFGVDFISHI